MAAMGYARSVVRSVLVPGAAALVVAFTAGCPKPPPPAMPPTDVPRIGNVTDANGERSDVVFDAVQSGSNKASIQYDCGPPQSQGIVGRGVLPVDLSKCDFNRGEQTLVIANQSFADCPLFLITITGFHGPGTYNTSSLGHLSFGTAKLSQAACKWDGSLCLDWDGAKGPHPEASCTIEVNSDGGLQYGTSGATVSGTFVCSEFHSPYKGCAGAPAKTSCVVSRASFSVAGCSVSGASPASPAGKGKAAGKRAR